MSRMTGRALALVCAMLMLTVSVERSWAQYREIWRTSDAEVDWLMIIFGGYIQLDIHYADGLDKTGGWRSGEGKYVIVNRRIYVPIPFTGIGIGGGHIGNVSVRCFHDPNWEYDPKEPMKDWARWEDRLEKSGTPAFNPTFEKVYFSGKTILFYDIDPYTGENHIILDVDLPSSMWMVGDASAPSTSRLSVIYARDLSEILTQGESKTVFTYPYAKYAHKGLGELWFEAGTGLEDSLLTHRGLVWNEHYVLDLPAGATLNRLDTIIVGSPDSISADSLDSIVPVTSFLDLPGLPIIPIHIVDAIADEKDSHRGEGTFYIALTGVPLSIDRLRYGTVECTYNGQPQTPVINTMTITNSSYVLRLGTDFEVESYSNNVNVGTGQMTLRGLAPYFSGTRTIDFVIRPNIDAGLKSSVIADQIYTSNPITPHPVITLYDAFTLREGTDYVLTYKNNINVGIATITVTLTGDYSGTSDFYFNIVRKPLADNWIVPLADPVRAWTGNSIQPIPVVKDGGRTLIEGKDYDLSWDNNINIGHNTAQAIVTGRGNYGGQAVMPFTIAGKPLQNQWLDIVGSPPYTGQAPTASQIRPLITLIDGNIILTEGVDYSITGITFEAYNPDAVYNPAGGNTTDAGATWRVQLTGQDLYKGAASAPFTIQPKALPAGSLQPLSNTTFTYTGDSIRVDTSIVVMDGDKTLVRNRDYVVYGYINNIDVTDIAYFTIEGAGNYAGGSFTTFAITPKPLVASVIQPIADQTYTGYPLTPAITVKDGSRVLTPVAEDDLYDAGKVLAGNAFAAAATPDQTTATASTLAAADTYIGDYAITGWNNNTNAGSGTASVTIQGYGNYTATATATFNILPKAIGDNYILPIADQPYTGISLYPDITVKDPERNAILTAGIDYALEYTGDLINVGTGSAAVRITGIGNYTGTALRFFTIARMDTARFAIAPIAEYIYTGNAIRPLPAVSDTTGGKQQLLDLDADYTLLYSNNTNVGTATLTVVGKGNYKGAATTTFAILPRAIADSWLQPIAEQTSTGDSIRPPVVLIDPDNRRTLTPVTDYTVAYSDNVDTGMATADIEAIGNYQGSTTTLFAIAPIHDTLYQDTIYLYKDTLVVHDTFTVVQTDTLYRDTFYQTDTLYQYKDTLTLTDTVYDTTEIEVYRVDSFYIVVNEQTGARYPVTANARATSYDDVLLLEGLTPGQPFIIYTIKGETCLRGVAWANGTFAVYNLPYATYILWHEGAYSKFTHR